MLTIQINSKQYDIPTQWDEITLRQYTQLVNNAGEINHIRLLSVFTDISYETLCNLPCDEFTIKVLPQMDFLGKEFNPFHLKRKKRITIGGNEIETIRDPSQERFGQKLYMQQLVHDAIEKNVNHVTLVAPVVACYYAPYLHGENKWDEKHVKTVETLVENMLVCEAFPEADFFLRGYIRYAPTKITY